MYKCGFEFSLCPPPCVARRPTQTPHLQHHPRTRGSFDLLPDKFPADGHASTSKRRRRASISGRCTSSVKPSPLVPNNGAQLVHLEDERTQYVLIDHDIVSHAATQRNLRGPLPSPHPTLLHPCVSSSSSSHAPALLPPTYTLHTALTVPPQTLLARYPPPSRPPRCTSALRRVRTLQRTEAIRAFRGSTVASGAGCEGRGREGKVDLERVLAECGGEGICLEGCGCTPYPTDAGAAAPGRLTREYPSRTDNIPTCACRARAVALPDQSRRGDGRRYRHRRQGCAPRACTVRGVPPPPLTPPRLGSPSPFAASSSLTTPHPSSSASAFLVASSPLSIAHLSTSNSTKSTSSSSSKPTPSLMPTQLAGAGVPPPSPQRPAARWGPLIDAVRRVRAVERERGSGGWGGVVLDREVGVFCRWVWGAVCERRIYGGYTAVGTSANRYATSSSTPYELVERAGEWDVVPEGVAYGVKGSRTEEGGEVDVVSGGIAADDPARKDRGKGKAPVPEETVDVDVDGAVDVFDIDAVERAPTLSTTTSLPRAAPTASTLSLPTRATAATRSLCGSLA
ncbi:hypothetical protein B0H13DRAFT_2305900 [Mycena leptocephala]|nr:hypothetical protein B0H13DRAFT_2305900 [Mycena leptocephala]